MLAVGNDKLTMRDNDNALLEVAKAGCAGRLGEVTWMGLDMGWNM